MPNAESSSSTVGLIGAGLLGNAMADRLVTGGFDMLGYDRDPARGELLLNLGGRVAASAVEVASACDRVILSLPTSSVVAEVVKTLEGALRPGLLLIDTTTGEPQATEDLGRGLARRGVQYLDATVSGSSEQARRGDIVLMVGGDLAAFSACGDLFERLGRRTFHVGPCGSGARVKLVNNLVLGLNRAALAEGLAFAQRLDLDLAAVLEILREGIAYSRVMNTKGQKMISGDFSPQARLSQHLKDVHLILAEAERSDLKLPLSAAHGQLLQAALAAGFGEADNSAVIRAYQ